MIDKLISQKIGSSSIKINQASDHQYFEICHRSNVSRCKNGSVHGQAWKKEEMNRDEAKKIYSGNGTDTVANREALEEGRGGGRERNKIRRNNEGAF